MIQSQVNLPLSYDKNLYKISEDNKSIEFYFTGEATSVFLSQGKYKFEAYGAGGGGYSSSLTSARDLNSETGCIDEEIVKKYGGNAVCNHYSSQPGAGGYASGVIKILRGTRIYVVVGEQGKFGNGEQKGGFNGGGSSFANTSHKSGSGGGATDFRILKNSLYNRVLVAGGGGGPDNYYGDYLGSDDGSGGSGGYPSQGLWNDGNYMKEYEANSTFGFSFGQGQRSYFDENYERAGAGGGFFGGFSIDEGNAGASGGSSFALTPSLPLPIGLIEAHDENGNLISKQKYAFDYKSEYSMSDVAFATGIRVGNGLARITLIESYSNEVFPNSLRCTYKQRNAHLSFVKINQQVQSV